MKQEEEKQVLSNLELPEGSRLIEDPNYAHTYMVYEHHAAVDEDGESRDIFIGKLPHYRVEEFLSGEIDDLYQFIY